MEARQVDAGAGDSSSKLHGRCLVLVAALLWSTSGLFAKSPAFADWPITESGFAVRGPLLALWRAAFACLVLLPMVRRPRWTPRLLPAVIAFAAMNFTFLTALTATTAANAIWLQYTAPAWVFLFSVVLWREPVLGKDLAMLACGVVGVVVIIAFEIRGESRLGVAMGLLSGLTYASVIVTLRWLRDVDTAWVVGVNHLTTVALFAPYCLSLGISPSGSQWPYLAAFGMLQMGLPYWIFARGLRIIPGHEASLLLLVEPALVPIWVWLAWRNSPGYEPPHWWTLAGGGIILTGLLLRYGRLRPRA